MRPDDIVLDLWTLEDLLGEQLSWRSKKVGHCTVHGRRGPPVDPLMGGPHGPTRTYMEL